MDLLAVWTVLEALGANGIRTWVGGGWGVDALVGRVTRPHRDLDLAVDAERLDDAVRVLGRLGYAPETDWLPVRLELAAPGVGEEIARVDLHPVRLAKDGSGRQAGPDGGHFTYPAGDWAVGWLDGRVVPCISARLQRVFHEGYEPSTRDRQDLAQLDEVGVRTECWLLVEVPAAEPVVGALRARLDGFASLGVPAHLTVLGPLMPQRELDAAVLDRMARVVATQPALRLSFSSTAWFGDDVLWVAPDDPVPLVGLSTALQRAFPEWPAYGGAYAEFVPHLTVGHGHPVEELRAAEREVRRGLPFSQVVDRVGLFVGGPTVGFRRVQEFPLG